MSPSFLCHDTTTPPNDDDGEDDDHTACTGLYSVPLVGSHHHQSPMMSPQQQTFATPLISLPEPDDSQDRYTASRRRRRSSLSSRGFLKRDDDDFLLMEVQVEHTSTNFMDDEEDDEDDGETASTCGLLDHRADDAKLWKGSVVPITRYAPEKRSLMAMNHHHHAATPLPPLPEVTFLDEEYRKTKIRFMQSILRSNSTRAIIQYQRRILFETRAGHWLPPLPPLHGNPASGVLCGTSHITFDTQSASTERTNDLLREGLLAMIGSQCEGR